MERVDNKVATGFAHKEYVVAAAQFASENGFNLGGITCADFERLEQLVAKKFLADRSDLLPYLKEKKFLALNDFRNLLLELVDASYGEEELEKAIKRGKDSTRVLKLQRRIDEEYPRVDAK